MSNDSSSNKAQYTKRTSAFILPTKRSKKLRVGKSSEYPSISNRATNINNRSPILVDLDNPSAGSNVTLKQLNNTGTSCGIDKSNDLNSGDNSDDEIIDMTRGKHRSLDTKAIPSTDYIDIFSRDNNGNDGDNHIIDLTDSATITLSPPRPFSEALPSDSTNRISPDLIPLDMFKERGAASSHASLSPRLDVTPKAANEPSKARHQNGKTFTKRKTSLLGNQEVRLQPIDSICHQAPNYESLTLIELRNAVKKHGFKIKDRQSMIDTLKNIQSVINANPQAPSISAPLLQEPPISIDNPPAESLQNQKFANRVKNDTQLWERILRYENVDLKICSQGLAAKEKTAYLKYLEENALVCKPSPKTK